MRLDITLVPLVLASVCLATPWVAENYPNPKTNPEKCGRKISGDSLWLCDPDTVLGTDGTAILREIQDVNAGADCVCNCTDNPDSGYTIGVAVAESITGQHEDQTAKLNAFSQTVKESWFGMSTCDDKILILLVRNSSQIHITLGSGINDILPEETLDNIDTEINPKLDVSQYKEALEISVRNLVLAMNENIGLYATGTQSTMTTEAPEPENNLVWGILGVIAIMSILIFHYWIKY